MHKRGAPAKGYAKETMKIFIILLAVMLLLLFYISYLFFRNQEELDAARKEHDEATERTDSAVEELWDMRANFINGAELYKWIDGHDEKGSVSLRELKRHISEELHCLTPVPMPNYPVSLIGRDKIKEDIREILEKGNRAVMLYGQPGMGKTEIMRHICDGLITDGKYVAWIPCERSLKEDLLALRNGLNIPETDGSDTAYEKVVRKIQENREFAGNFYLFLDGLSYDLTDDEWCIIKSLGTHIIASSTSAHFAQLYFRNIRIDALPEQAAVDMFYGYYLKELKGQGGSTRQFEDAVRYIVACAQYNTLIVELLAKAAAKNGWSLQSFRDKLERDGLFDVFEGKIRTNHSGDLTIRECIAKICLDKNP